MSRQEVPRKVNQIEKDTTKYATQVSNRAVYIEYFNKD